MNNESVNSFHYSIMIQDKKMLNLLISDHLIAFYFYT